MRGGVPDTIDKKIPQTLMLIAKTIQSIFFEGHHLPHMSLRNIHGGKCIARRIQQL